MTITGRTSQDLNLFLKRYLVGSGDYVGRTEDLSITDGAFWAIYSSMTGPFLVPLIIVLLGSNAPIGYILGLPVLLVPLAQYISQIASRAAKDLRSLTIVITLFDRLLWIPIILMVFVHGYFNRLFFLFLFLSLRTFFASFSGTTWTLWVPTVVPREHRAEYFARRGFVMKIFSLVGYILALGIFLRIPDEVTALIIVFFTGSLIFSSISLFVMSRIPSFSLSSEDRLRARKVEKSFFSYLMFSIIWSVGYGMVLPYFQLYVISGNFLNQSETFYTLVFVVISVASISSQLFWGRFSSTKGNVLSILIAGTLSAFSTLFIAFIHIPAIIFLPAILFGAAQSGISLAMFNEMVHRSSASRIRSISYYNLGQTLSVASGPIIANFLFDLNGYQIGPVFITAFFLMLSSLLMLTLSGGLRNGSNDIELKLPSGKKSG